MNIAPIMFLSVFVTSLLGNLWYPRLAMRLRIHAVPNYRSLHQKITPRGAGIVIATVYLAAIAISYGLGAFDFTYLMAFWAGPACIAVIGLADDKYELPAWFRFCVQFAAANWILLWLGGMPPLGLGGTTVELGWMGYALAAAAMVWFFNLVNFMDGIDGMVASGSLYVTAAASVILLWNGDTQLAQLSLLLFAATAGFVYFNWPPARVFLGDAGSSFFSYFLAALILATLWSDGMSLWTWLILLGPFVVDTTVTMLIRVATVPNWYRAHRSHAYQNLARIWNSHLKVVRLVLLVDFLWLLPLALLSAWRPNIAPWLTLVALAPIAVFVVRNGPLRENQ